MIVFWQMGELAIPVLIQPGPEIRGAGEGVFLVDAGQGMGQVQGGKEQAGITVIQASGIDAAVGVLGINEPALAGPQDYAASGEGASKVAAAQIGGGHKHPGLHDKCPQGSGVKVVPGVDQVQGGQVEVEACPHPGIIPGQFGEGVGIVADPHPDFPKGGLQQQGGFPLRSPVVFLEKGMDFPIGQGTAVGAADQGGVIELPFFPPLRHSQDRVNAALASGLTQL